MRTKFSPLATCLEKLREDNDLANKMRLTVFSVELHLITLNIQVLAIFI